MTMMGWRFMYWLFFAVGVIGVVLGAAAFLRAAHHQRRKVQIATATALILAGLGGTLVVAAAGPGGFGHNMIGLVMGMMGNRSDVGPAPSASPGAPKQAMQASEFAFSPAEFSVQAGVTVNVEFQNGGRIFHTFTVRDMNFELEANGGQMASGALRADRPGIFEFICSVPGHAQSGMRGRVIAS